MKNKGFTMGELLVVIMIAALILVCPLGWCMNIAKLTKCDFKEPYKAEIIRGVGIFAVPVGVIAGYMTIKDN
jgi:prepilin-type N-terminal cleavage/methylation domain-containing protein